MLLQPPSTIFHRLSLPQSSGARAWLQRCFPLAPFTAHLPFLRPSLHHVHPTTLPLCSPRNARFTLKGSILRRVSSKGGTRGQGRATGLRKAPQLTERGRTGLDSTSSRQDESRLEHGSVHLQTPRKAATAQLGCRCSSRVLPWMPRAAACLSSLLVGCGRMRKVFTEARWKAAAGAAEAGPLSAPTGLARGEEPQGHQLQG